MLDPCLQQFTMISYITDNTMSLLFFQLVGTTQSCVSKVPEKTIIIILKGI